MPNSYSFSESELTYVSKAEQYCAVNEQCRSAVRDKLYAWGAERELTERVIEHLVKNDFINEARYCKLYCDSKLRLQKWGRIKISYQLRLKRIDTRTVNEAVNNLDPELYQQTLVSLAESKNETIKEPDENKRKAKLISFLASHGFEQNEINSVLNNLETK